MLLEVVEDGPEVDAEEVVCVVGFVIELLYLEVEGGPLKQTAVLPGQNQRNTQQPVSPKTVSENIVP